MQGKWREVRVAIRVKKVTVERKYLTAVKLSPES
jgi:hypothetical protein